MQPSRRKHLFTGALLAAMAVAAQAQPAPNGAPAPQGRHQHDPARMAERVNKHLADLKQKLQVTPTQEPAWTSFSNAMQPTSSAQRPDRQALANLSTPDRLDQMRALRTQRNAEMDRRADATKAFYAQLSAEQKKTFDGETARLYQGRGGRHHG
jgi:protein CpxP